MYVWIGVSDPFIRDQLVGAPSVSFEFTNSQSEEGSITLRTVRTLTSPLEPGLFGVS